jgi:ferredoxin
VAGFEERAVGGLKVRIDRELCVGFGDCVTGAPEAFELDGEGLAVFKQPQAVPRERLLAACDACPVDAITVWDETGAELVPRPKPANARG